MVINYEKIILDLSSKNYEDKVFKYFYQIHNLFEFGENVIDLGCGHGKFSIMSRDLGHKVTGIDARNVRIPFNEKNINWVISDVCDLKTIKSDTILYFGLLYHLNYEQQVNLLEKMDTNLLVINTHFANIDNDKILNITNNDKLTIVKNHEYQGVIYEESKTLESLKTRPLASFSNITSFWPTLECLSNMLKNIGGYKNVYVVEPYLMGDRTYIIAKK